MIQDPFPYFERFPDADILTSSDEVVNSVEDDKLENWEKCKLPHFNIHFVSNFAHEDAMVGPIIIHLKNKSQSGFIF